MSEETHVDQIESGNNIESNVVLYSTRFVEQTIERALDAIYEQSNDTDPKIHEWRHSLDKINVSSN